MGLKIETVVIDSDETSRELVKTYLENDISG